MSGPSPPRNLALVLAVTQTAIASAMTMIARADDSSGIIGDACRRLLDLHPGAAARAAAPAGGSAAHEGGHLGPGTG